jgi:hypothetical protein
MRADEGVYENWAPKPHVTAQLNVNSTRRHWPFRTGTSSAVLQLTALKLKRTISEITQSGNLVDTNLVFVKTEKGRSEIETREHNIHYKQRIALILVNGKSTVGEMLPKIPGEGIALLEVLQREGFIAAVGGNAPTTSAVSASSVGQSAPGSAGGETASTINNTTAEKAEFNLETAKRQAVKVIESVLGPGGESMAMAIERCKSRDDFEKQAKRTLELISRVGGPRKAAEFLAQTGLQ